MFVDVSIVPLPDLAGRVRFDTDPGLQLPLAIADGVGIVGRIGNDGGNLIRREPSKEFPASCQWTGGGL